MQGIVGFKCDKCGHKITEKFDSFDEMSVLFAWSVARSKYDKHVYGAGTQEERDKERCGDDCNG